MINNLNDLNTEQIKELEKHILTTTSNKDVVEFFNALKSGRLKNKNVEIDALDFIYEGLSNLVENWVKINIQNKSKQQKEISLRKLFDRREIIKCETDSTNFAQSIKEILEKNGYPQRSENLKFKKRLEPNAKFIKDGYIYLLRGDQKGQSSGFFSYGYIQGKENISGYIETQKDITLETLAYQHGIKGKGRFISATTNLGIAEQFATDYDNGSIYIIKIKENSAYKVEQPIDKLNMSSFDLDLGNGEREYLIPDCIYPDEICAEFKCYEHRKVFNYLVNVVGLKITPFDIGFPEVSERTENMKRFTDNLYKKYHNKIFENKKFSESQLDLLAENPEMWKNMVQQINQLMGREVEDSDLDK